MFSKRFTMFTILSVFFLIIIGFRFRTNTYVNPSITEEIKNLVSTFQNEVLELSENETYHDLFLKEHSKHMEIREFDRNNGAAKRVPILIYHHLLLSDENNLKDNKAIINVESFYTQMELLYKNGYTTVTLRELEKWLLGELELPKKSIVITFDDGYLSNYIYAYPILKKFDFRASQFLITSIISDQSQPFDPNFYFQYLSWEDIVKTLDIFEYSNHTHDLHQVDGKRGYILTKPIEDVYADISKNMSLTQSPYFAYPFGHYNDDVIEALVSSDIRMAFTVKKGSIKKGDSPFELKRYGIFPSTSVRKFKRIINKI